MHERIRRLPAVFALSLAGCYFRLRGTLFAKRWLLWLFVVTILPALAANHAGWVAPEVGRPGALLRVGERAPMAAAKLEVLLAHDPIRVRHTGRGQVPEQQLPAEVAAELEAVEERAGLFVAREDPVDFAHL